MADLLKITTPLVNKNQQVQAKPGIDPTAPFQMQDISKVTQPPSSGDILKQNTGLINQGDRPTILDNLLKDPSVTAAYLKNIFMLEELIKLLPANNKTVTDEIEKMFQTLLVNYQDIANEMKQQEASATSFRGELFSFLREVSNHNSGQQETQYVIANLLRSLNHLTGNRDIRDAVANSLQYLADNLNSSKALFPQLKELAAMFRGKAAEQNFDFLKKETLSLLQDIRESVLFSPKLEKVVSITIYNLSRHNNDDAFLQQSTAALWRLLNFEQRDQFKALLSQFLEHAREGEPPPKEGSSQVMETLVELITTQSKSEMNTAEQGRMEKIIHSLLSSPCNFTPLLHFVVPVEFQTMRSFAEIWINPNSEEEEPRAGAEKRIHILLVIDIESIGRFEVELNVHGQTLDFSLFCPSGVTESYKGIRSGLSRVMQATPYRLGEVRVDSLEHPRSLMEVFKSLPYRRVGVDVKI